MIQGARNKGRGAPFDIIHRRTLDQWANLWTIKRQWWLDGHIMYDSIIDMVVQR